jgi:hypothetical protein
VIPVKLGPFRRFTQLSGGSACTAVPGARQKLLEGLAVRPGSMGGFAPDRGLRVLRRFSCPNKKWLIELRPFRLERIRLLGTWHCMDQNTGFEAQPASSTRHIGLRRLFGICHKPMPWKMEVLRLRMEHECAKAPPRSSLFRRFWSR